MYQVYGLFCMILFSAEASSNEISFPQRTNVVSLTFCESSLPAEEKMGKERLEKVHTFAQLKDDPLASLPDSFSVCSTIMIKGCQSYIWPMFFNILDNNKDQFMAPFLSYGVIQSRLMIAFNQGDSQTLIGKVPPLFPNQWTKSCMAVNATSGLINWVVEGTLVFSSEFEEMKNSKSQPKDLGKKIVLGAESYGGSWFAAPEKVTNLNIFSSLLSLEKMKSMTKGGSCVEEGDYLAWGDMEWILHGQAKKETTDKEATCEKPLVDLFYAQFPSMDACIQHCENLGTRVPSVATFEDWTKLKTFLKKKLYDKGLDTLQIWLPIKDREAEGVWKDSFTNQVVENYTQPWIGSKPSGGKAENCARLLNENDWADIDCHNPNYACMCSHKSYINLKLRGLCPSSVIDVYYKPMNKETDIRELIFQGLTHTSIEYGEEKMWTLAVIDSNVTGTSTASFASFTLGRHNWTIRGDIGCSSGDNYVTELKMSRCQEDEFTCNDGQCVRMHQRCNQLPDCRDESDETNCRILVLKDGYNMELPPIDSSDPVNVSVSIDLLRIVDINEEDYSIEIQFEISLNWKEKRAMYQNLKKRDSLNALPRRDVDILWLPEVVYENTDQKETTRLGEYGKGEWKTKVVVRKEVENGTMSGLESVDETEIFKGSENRLVMNQTYTHTFQCNYELSNYPFDTQVN